MRYVGLDLGNRKISFCEASNGKVIDRATVGSVEDLASRLGPNSAQAMVLIEACREAWFVHKKLTSWGHQVKLLDTTRARRLGIGQHGRKNDRIDASVLAIAIEEGRVPEAHLLSPQRQELRKQIGIRRALVEARATMATTLRGIARAEGVKLPRVKPEYLVSKLKKTPLPEQLRAVIAPLVETCRVLDDQIRELDARLVLMNGQDPVAQLLMTCPGVSLIIAASFISVIDEASRFKNAHQVASYLGLVPALDCSGDSKRIGRITKQGNSYLRSLLVQAAANILRQPDSADPVRTWGKKLIESRGKKIATIAVARKLAGVLWAMWRDGTVYDSAFLAEQSARGASKQAQRASVRAKALKIAAAKLSRKQPKLGNNKCSEAAA